MNVTFGDEYDDRDEYTSIELPPTPNRIIQESVMIPAGSKTIVRVPHRPDMMEHFLKHKMFWIAAAALAFYLWKKKK